MPDYSKLPKGLTSLLKGAESAAPAVNRLDMNFKDVTKRIPELTDAANMVARGEMTAGQYDSLVRKLKPVTPYDFVPQPATSEDAMRALNEAKRPMFGKANEMTAGEQADLRLDIPAYKDHGVWVNSIHRKDQPTVYGSTSSVKNATMIGAPDKALKVAQGGPKAPFAVIRGDWNPMDEKKAVKNAQKYLDHPDWKQVGYDPERHGYFYDRSTMAPVIGADEVIQIGPLVLAKKPKYGNPDDFPFKKGGAIRMQVGGLTKIAQLVKGAQKVLPAAEREANLAKFLEPSKTQMRLYHGTTATESGKGKEAFRSLKPSKEGALGSGVYLTPNSEFASTYAGFPARSQLERDIQTGSDFAKESASQLLDRMNQGAIESHEIGGNMLPVHAQLRNPLIIEGTHNDPMIEALIKLGVDENKASRMVEKAYEEKGYIGKQVQSRAQAQGYDGLMQYRDGDLSEVVSYNPNAVKSAIGNQGTYNINYPDLSKANGGGIHMQVGGLSALANIGKATKAGSKLSAAEIASLRASGMEIPGVHFADSLNPNDIMRMSEALGAAGAEGKTLNLTQADRSRVHGPNKGGTGFSGLQLTSPAHQQAGSTWGVGKKGHVSRLTNATSPDTIWSTFIGSPTQHMSNPVTVERMYDAHRKANPSAELVGKMNDSLNSAVNKKGNLVFPNGIDLSDPSSLNQAQTFDQRKLVAKALVMGGQKKGEQASRDAFKIIQEETDPLLMDSPTYAVGNRLFTIDKNSGLYRPDLNSAFPHITTGTDMGLLFDPAPVEHAIPGFVKQFANRLNKNGEIQPMGHKDLTATTPSVFVDYKYLTDLQKEGYKDGGSTERPPFHDFDQIMQRKNGGTVNTTFEQRLKSAIDQHMASGGTVERHYAEAGSVPAPTTQELESMADSQGAAFGVFPHMANKRWQQESPTMGKASDMLKAQITKEWEQAGRPDGAKGLALRIGAVMAGQGGDLLNFAQTMIPSLYDEKPTSVLESGKKPPAPYRDTRELQRIPKFPMTGSSEIKQSMREKGMINEDEYPLFELAGAIGAPMALAKAPSAIKGGLQMAKESPALNKGAEYIGRGASLAQVPIRRPFTPATATVESTAPDLGQGTTYGFRQGLNDVLLENPKLGTGRNKIREGQGTFTNAKGELELNPMLGIDIPRAGNLGDTPNANLALRKQMGQMGVDLNQEAMAAHRFIPLMTNNVRDASSVLIKTKEGLTAGEVAELAKQLGGNMAVTHNPKLGGVVVFPFGEVKKGQIPRELLRAQQAAGKVLGDRSQVKFGISDYGKDRAYMMASEGDYTKAGAQPMSKTQQAQREKMQGLEKFLFPDSRSGIPGQVKAAPVGGLQPWSVGRDYPTSIIGIGNGNKTQYQPVNFSTGKEGSKYDKYLEAEAERAKMLDEFHRALVPRYR